MRNKWPAQLGGCATVARRAPRSRGTWKRKCLAPARRPLGVRERETSAPTVATRRHRAQADRRTHTHARRSLACQRGVRQAGRCAANADANDANAPPAPIHWRPIAISYSARSPKVLARYLWLRISPIAFGSIVCARAPATLLELERRRAPVQLVADVDAPLRSGARERAIWESLASGGRHRVGGSRALSDLRAPITQRRAADLASLAAGGWPNKAECVNTSRPRHWPASRAGRSRRSRANGDARRRQDERHNAPGQQVAAGKLGAALACWPRKSRASSRHAP